MQLQLTALTALGWPGVASALLDSTGSDLPHRPPKGKPHEPPDFCSLGEVKKVGTLKASTMQPANPHTSLSNCIVQVTRSEKPS
jgi:hypothetical protein